MLLDFCASNNLFILNGRIGSKNTNSKTTCKGKSTVDYFISSLRVLNNVTDFEIYQYQSLYSDVHCPVVINLKLTHETEKLGNIYDRYEENDVRMWNDEKKNEFALNIDTMKVNEIMCIG